VRERIIDPRRGVLYDGGFGIFHLSFSFTGNLVTQHRRVNAGLYDQYEVPLVGGHNVSGEVNSGVACPRALALSFSATRRARRANGRASQKWFRDQERHGVEALRAAIRTLKSEVLIVDPYFGGDDVMRIILAIPDPEIPVRVLTSHMHLRRRRSKAQPSRPDQAISARRVRRFLRRCAIALSEGWGEVTRRVRAALSEEFDVPSAAADLGNSEGAYLARKIEEANVLPHSNPITVHVMQGGTPAIHDRFISDPERLWMLGSSINAFGSRGTLMILVPDPEPIVADLERVWTTAMPLARWLEERSEATP
jgi:hypothetical protein